LGRFASWVVLPHTGGRELGMNWQPIRFVILVIIVFGSGFAVKWR